MTSIQPENLGPLLLGDSSLGGSFPPSPTCTSAGDELASLLAVLPCDSTPTTNASEPVDKENIESTHAAILARLSKTKQQPLASSDVLRLSPQLFQGYAEKLRRLLRTAPESERQDLESYLQALETAFDSFTGVRLPDVTSLFVSRANGQCPATALETLCQKHRLSSQATKFIIEERKLALEAMRRKRGRRVTEPLRAGVKQGDVSLLVRALQFFLDFDPDNQRKTAKTKGFREPFLTLQSEKPALFRRFTRAHSRLWLQLQRLPALTNLGLVLS
eukprot:m.114142 g.114142  ORF g.114142 m.114142 type:complete len:275 (+) comp22914_c0_seq1:464-1288(+)